MERTKGPLSVTQLNDYLKMLLDGDRVLSDVWVRGEISNFTVPRSGHLYLTLKDEEGQVRSVMFRTYAMRLPFTPNDGMKVLAHGRVSLWGPSGQYQLYIDEMQPDGIGSLAMRYEQLRRQLEAEGLFAESRKKPLPAMPMRIGVITSPSGAAVHDIKNILGRRFPCAEMILFPSAVQGVEAPEQLKLGIEFFDATKLCDVIIIGRGGGSAEDLWAFNDEALARAIAACSIPVISAVGHESDFTICDFVADRRAPTPSAAAELAVPDRFELLSWLHVQLSRMQTLTLGRLTQEKRILQQIASSPTFKRPERILDAPRQRAVDVEERLDRAMKKRLETQAVRLSEWSAKLDAMSPLAVLSRGYAFVSSSEKNITKAAHVSVGDRLKIRFADGSVYATATDREGVEKDHDEEK